MDQIILWLELIISWVSLLFINKHSLKRFMPVGLLSALLVTVVFEIGYRYHWWTILKGIFPREHIFSYPLIFGAFFVGTLWIFHFTYDKSFRAYILTNIVIDALYAFVLINIFIYLDIYKLDRLGNFSIYALMLLIALVLYAYQRWQDKVIKKEE